MGPFAQKPIVRPREMAVAAGDQRERPQCADLIKTIGARDCQFCMHKFTEAA